MKKTITTFVVACLLTLSACNSVPSGPVAVGESKADSGPITLRESDTIRITFPGSPNLDTQQTIRRDGRITLPLLGEYVVAGKTPTDLEKALVEAYGNQVVSKEISVTVLSSSYPVFLSGAVMKPGKIQADRPLTALEAVMEAGGFDYTKGDLTRVTIIRTENDQTKHYYVDLKAVLEGRSTARFYVKPMDIVYVPERFVWF